MNENGFYRCRKNITTENTEGTEENGEASAELSPSSLGALGELGELGGKIPSRNKRITKSKGGYNVQMQIFYEFRGSILMWVTGNRTTAISNCLKGDVWHLQKEYHHREHRGHREE